MKKSPVDKVINETTNEIVLDLLKSVPEIKFISRLDDALRARGLTQGKLATLTGLRPTTISELVNGSRLSITKTHIASVMIALRITDIKEILDIEFAPETVEKFEKESKDWIEKDVIPEEIVKTYSENAKKLYSSDIRS